MEIATENACLHMNNNNNGGHEASFCEKTTKFLAFGVLIHMFPGSVPLYYMNADRENIKLADSCELTKKKLRKHARSSRVNHRV